jgi:peptide/nickel transport system ATP-binding protein
MKDSPMKPLLDIKDLRKWFRVEASGDEDSEHYVKAVDDVTFVIHGGETFSVVGESGCGKSTLGRSFFVSSNLPGVRCYLKAAIFFHYPSGK